MEFGLFVEFPSNEHTTQAQILKDSMELIDAAEESGSEGIWLAEFHAARKKAGHTGTVDVGLRVPVYVAETKEKAYSEPKESIMYQMQRLIRVITDYVVQTGITVGDDRASQANAFSPCPTRTCWTTLLYMAPLTPLWRDYRNSRKSWVSTK